MKNSIYISYMCEGFACGPSDQTGAALAGAPKRATIKLGKFMKQDLSAKWSYPFSQRFHGVLSKVASASPAVLRSQLDPALKAIAAVSPTTEGRPS
jgi:hypothetical protein